MILYFNRFFITDEMFSHYLTFTDDDNVDKTFDREEAFTIELMRELQHVLNTLAKLCEVILLT